MADWYCDVSYWGFVTQWTASTIYSVGALRRQSGTPTVGNERVFRCTTAGTSGGSQPIWNLTKGATTTDGSVTWTEVTGNSTYGWTAPHARLETALGWLAAGDTCWVGFGHFESKATNITLASPGTISNPCYIAVGSQAAFPPTSLVFDIDASSDADI